MTNTSPTLPNPYPTGRGPVFDGDDEAWQTWLVKDQRFVDGRPDVLTYVSRAADNAAALKRRTPR